jgi:hypothetical protein
MFPPKGSGLEQIIKALDKKYPGLTQGRPIQWPFSNNNVKKTVDTRPLNIQNPMQSLQKIQNSVQNIVSDLTKNITTTISQFTKKEPQEDYNAVVAGFTPPGTRLIVPEYPSGSEAILLSDLDGDSQNELIASYRHNDGSLRTLILKKLQYNWVKQAEITNTGTESIHYRNIADITGNKKVHLLLGLNSNKKHRTLYGYSLEGTGISELFSKNYSKLEVLGIGKSKTASGKPRIALWNENDDKTYDIEYMGWNGNQLDTLDAERYYYKKVLPYYARMVKKNPNEVYNWYVFADALAKAGAKEDALNVINYGRKRDRNSEYTDKFLNLANRL